MKKIMILGEIFACLGLIFIPATVTAEKPKPVEVVNDNPIQVVSSTVEPVNVVDVTETPKLVEVANTLPILVSESYDHDNIFNIGTLRPGGRTIAGPGCHDFETADEKISHTFFRVFTGSAFACVTIQNTGDTHLRQIFPTTGGIPVGSTNTVCERFEGDTWVKVETINEGFGSFCWRVDLLEVISFD